MYLGEALVDADVAEVAIDKAEADGNTVVNGVELGEALGGESFEAERLAGVSDGSRRRGLGRMEPFGEGFGELFGRDGAAIEPALADIAAEQKLRPECRGKGSRIERPCPTCKGSGHDRHRRTVTRWINAYCADGPDGLRPRKAKGTPGKIPKTLADEVRRWVIEGPAKQGLDRANWTHEELADHLRKTRGVRTSRSAVQRFCSKIGIRLYRPTYRYLRGNP